MWGRRFDPRKNSSSRDQYWQQLRARQTEFSDLVDPSANTRGFTALHYACLASSGNAAVLAVLQNHHADPTVKDNAGHVAADYADTKLQQQMEHVQSHYNTWHAEEVLRRADADREQRRLFPLEARVKEKLVGQDGPINSVAAAIRRRENGWHDDEHPLVFLFLGSSGLGKTELAKQVAAYIHSDDRKGQL
jgi:ATP-dependent Clp protease ATP-binding subunit ClpB